MDRLPNELVLLVFRQIDDSNSLQAAACTCKKFRGVAEICLYSRAHFTKRSSAERLLELCREDSNRAAYVQDLRLLYSTQYHDFLNTSPLDLCYFSCLNSFVSESPFCNSHSRVGMKSESVWRADMQAYLRAFEQASLLSDTSSGDKPLSYLRSCKHNSLHIMGICTDALETQ